MYEFTKNEIRDLLIAFAVLSISFAICNVGTDPFGIASILPIVMIGVGADSYCMRLDTNSFQ